MKNTKHFALTALFVVGALLGASTPVQAQYGGGFPLTCVVGIDDPDYGASGQYSFGGRPAGRAWEPGYDIYYFAGSLVIECWDLTPHAVYSAGGKKERANNDGSLSFVWKRVTFAYYVSWGASFQDGWWAVSAP